MHACRACMLLPVLRVAPLAACTLSAALHMYVLRPSLSGGKVSLNDALTGCVCNGRLCPPLVRVCPMGLPHAAAFTDSAVGRSPRMIPSSTISAGDIGLSRLLSGLFYACAPFMCTPRRPSPRRKYNQRVHPCAGPCDAGLCAVAVAAAAEVRGGVGRVQGAGVRGGGGPRRAVAAHSGRLLLRPPGVPPPRHVYRRLVQLTRTRFWDLEAPHRCSGAGRSRGGPFRRVCCEFVGEFVGVLARFRHYFRPCPWRGSHAATRL